MSDPPPRALVVSLHDVSPHTREATARMLSELETISINHCSLLVIPNHHHRGHVRDDPNFCAWLDEQEKAGHEIVIHGYYHQRERRPGERFVQRMMTRVYTADEGEFYDLNRETAQTLLRRAREDFAAIGHHPDGFIAPAWLLSSEAERACAEEGFAYTTRLGSITDLAAATNYHSQSLVWSVRSAWRRTVSRWWNASLFTRLRSNPLLRISAHPVDLEHPAIWKQILDLTRRARLTCESMTYLDWIRAQRRTASPVSCPS